MKYILSVYTIVCLAVLALGSSERVGAVARPSGRAFLSATPSLTVGLLPRSLLLIANAQTGSNTKHYDKDGLAFDYPDDWQLTEDSSPEMLSLVPTHEGSLAQIVIRTQAHFGGIPGVTTTMDSGKSKSNDSPTRATLSRCAKGLQMI